MTLHLPFTGTGNALLQHWSCTASLEEGNSTPLSIAMALARESRSEFKADNEDEASFESIEVSRRDACDRHQPEDD